jgi:hypothetical protein
MNRIPIHSAYELVLLIQGMDLQEETNGRYGLRFHISVRELRMIHVIRHEIFMVCHSEEDGVVFRMDRNDNFFKHVQEFSSKNHVSTDGVFW